MSSTETLLVGSDGWEPANSLPAAVEGLRGVTIGDDIFLTGGKADNGTRSYVLRYIVARKEWEIVGNMAKPRSAHAATMPSVLVQRSGSIVITQGYRKSGSESSVYTN